MSDPETDILFLSHRYEVVSGGEKALLEMLEHLVSIGIKPHVIIGSTGNIIDHLAELGIPYSIIYLPFWVHSGNDPTPFEFTSLNPTVDTTLQIVNLIKKLKPKLCVTNTMVMPWLGYASSITGVPHAWIIHELGAAFNFRYAIGEMQTLRTIDNLGDKIFYNSRYTANNYLPHFTFNKDSPVLYPAGHTPRPTAIPPPFKRSGIKLICVGQIKPQKGQLDAIMAVKKLADTYKLESELLLVGGVEDTTYFNKLSACIRKNELDNHVRVLGHQADPASFVSHADIVISCATGESFGRVIVEGMLLKKPVIGANSAGTTEILDSEEYGFLYSPGNIEELTQQIVLLHKNPKKMAAIGLAAHEIAKKRYTPRKRYAPFVSFYKHLPKKTALDLSLLDAIISDFNGTVGLLGASRTEAERNLRSQVYKVHAKIKRRLAR